MSDGVAISGRARPIVYFWDGGWIAVGVSTGAVPAHSHHAVQVTLGLDGPIRFRHAEEAWMEDGGGIVTPNATHAFDGADRNVAMIFIAPECREGRWLTHSCRAPVQMVSAERYAQHLPALLGFQVRRPSAAEAAALLTAIVHSLCEGPPPLHRMDERIVKALAFIRDRDPRSITLEMAAKAVFLSAGRFAHLFTDEVGLPFRRYLLWRKLNRAIDAFGHGANLSTAAHEAGFSDSAHLTRTFHQMFGITPTVMMGTATFYAIPAPFELAEL